MTALHKKATMLGMSGLVTYLGFRLLAPDAAADANKVANSWNQRAAAAYLDQRAAWWMAWPAAARDHGTFCVSCHTAVPYALSRPALRTALGEESLSANERRLVDNVTKRVRLWKDVGVFYFDEADTVKSTQSRATEAVLNAVILANVDARSGKLTADTRAAFDNMWTLQETSGESKGAWRWLDFEHEPFEASDSMFYGAALAAVAVGIAPENYRALPEIQSHLKLLREYLLRECGRQSLINQVTLLWASARLPDLISAERQRAIISDVFRKQRADGGWSLSSLAWTWTTSSRSVLTKIWLRSSATPLSPQSDGYATGLIVFALAQLGVPINDVHLQRGRTWLVRNQSQSEGLWRGYSLSNRRDPSSGTGRFMSDAATAYAVLALTGTK